MLRTTALPVAVLLGASVLAPTAAHAVGETCHGLTATHVGSSQTLRLVGTEGPDVMVTNGAHTIEALGGDDVVCVTGFGSQVYAGAGDDLVDGSAIADFGAQVRLGAGSDRFVGGTAFEVVWTGEPVTEGAFEQADTDDDTVDTGPANPNDVIHDVVRTGQEGQPNGDVVRVDRGDVSWYGTPTAKTRLDGGVDAGVAFRPAAAHPLTIDTRAGTATFEGQGVVPVDGLTRFSVHADRGTRRFGFQGSGADEGLLLDLRNAAPYSVDMGGGDDRLSIVTVGRKDLAAGTSYDGGAGRDEITLALPDEADADLHLGKGRLSLGPARREVTLRAEEFEDAEVTARDVEVVGTAGRNDIAVRACRAHVDGRAGKDRVDATFRATDVSLRCDSVRATFLGGRGDDTLVGTRGRDRLVGGPGRDKADGAGWRDVCSAERVRRCEVRR